MDNLTLTTPEQPTQQPRPRPPVYIGKKRAYTGTGRRKTAIARVYLFEGTGKILINGKPLETYFTEIRDHNAVLGPLRVTDLVGRVDAKIHVHGGGFSGQAGACSQGMARAVKKMFGLDTTAAAEGQPADETIITMAKKLRDSGYLTRDGRMKERKKYGRKGARKSFQFSKR